MAKPVLLLFDDSLGSDSVGAAIRRVGRTRELVVRSIGLSELISVLHHRFAWALRAPEGVLNAHFGVESDFFLVNRLIGDVRDYRRRIGDFRILAAVDRWILSFPNRTCSPAMYSLAGSRLPLNLQWLQVASSLSEVRIPEFEYALSSEQIDVSGYNNPLDKNVFDGLVWDRSTEDPQRVSRFVVEQPKGVPVLSSFLGHRFLVTSPRDHSVVSGELASQLGVHGKAIGSLLDHRLGQALFFVDGETVVFASFVADHRGVKQVTEYSEWLHSALVEGGGPAGQ